MPHLSFFTYRNIGSQIVHVILCFAILLSVNSLNAQRVYNYNTPSSNCHCEMIFEETAFEPKGVIVLDANGADIQTFAKTNALVQSGLFKDYNILYINILYQGTAAKPDCYEMVIKSISYSKKINQSAFYFVNELEQTDVAIIKPNQNQTHFNQINFTGKDYDKLLYSLNTATNTQTYQQPVDDYYTYMQKFDLKMKNYKRNLDVGLIYGPMFLTGQQLTINKAGMGNVGLTINKNFGYQHSVRLAIMGSFKMPDQKSIQAGLQSKIMSAVQNDEDFIYIDEALRGHIYTGAHISYRYYLNATELFRPYVSAGIGSYNMTSISGRIIDTLDISDIDMSNPSSLQNALGGGLTPEDAGSLTNISTRYLTPSAEIGFEYRLTPGTKLNMGLPIQYYKDLSGTKTSTFAFGLNFGLSFTLNPNKLAKQFVVRPVVLRP